MTDRDARGSLMGAVATVGLVTWAMGQLLVLLLLAVSVASACVSVSYAVAFGLGLCLLVVVMRGNGRLLSSVRLNRSRELPPELGGGGPA